MLLSDKNFISDTVSLTDTVLHSDTPCNLPAVQVLPAHFPNLPHLLAIFYINHHDDINTEPPKSLTLLHSEWPKLYGVLAILSATGLYLYTTYDAGKQYLEEKVQIHDDY